LLAVTLEESIKAVYAVTFKNETIEQAFGLNSAYEKRQRNKDKSQVLDLLKKGYPIKYISKEFGIPKTTICNWRNKEAEKSA